MATDAFRIAFDTNILAYAEGVRRSDEDQVKVAESRRLLGRGGDWYLAAQALAELHYVLVRRMQLARREAAARLDRLTRRATVVASTGALLKEAFELAGRHALPTYDAIILAAAAEARCDILYSEDFQHGFGWRGVEVVNPFR